MFFLQISINKIGNVKFKYTLENHFQKTPNQLRRTIFSIGIYK